ncbi:MAG: hypothetical protein ACTS7I_02960 [Candidatus Hodgkinia cicadicola]
MATHRDCYDLNFLGRLPSSGFHFADVNAFPLRVVVWINGVNARGSSDPKLNALIISKVAFAHYRNADFRLTFANLFGFTEPNGGYVNLRRPLTTFNSVIL